MISVTRWLECDEIWSRVLTVCWILFWIADTFLLNCKSWPCLFPDGYSMALKNEVRVRFQACVCVIFHGEIRAGNTFSSNNSSVSCKYFSASDIKLAVDRTVNEKLVLLSRRCSLPENSDVDIFILTYHIKCIIEKNKAFRRFYTWNNWRHTII